MVVTKDMLLEKINSYEQSIHALLTMRQHLAHEFGAKSFIGRKMKTSLMNSISKGEDITPDMVSRFTNNTGFVGDVKITASNDRDYADAEKQIKKYDDELIGWDTTDEKVNHHDLYVIIHQSHTQQFVEYIRSKKGYIYDRLLSIFSFNIDSSKNTFYVLEKRGGEVPEILKKDFSKVVEVKYEYVYADMNKIKFYDAHPDVQYTMYILWDYIFSAIPTEDEFRASGGKRIIPIPVNVDDLRTRLKAYVLDQGTHRVPDLPKKEWIVEALDEFVKIGLAIRNDALNYTIKYWHVRKKRGQNNQDDVVRDFICERMVTGQEPLKV